MLVEGLAGRVKKMSPEVLARTEVFVNTRRMQRRIQALFDQGPACILPRIRLVTDLAHDPAGPELLAAMPPLGRRLQLGQLITLLLDKEPDLAPRSAVFDLADSLALLLDEMHDENVLPSAISCLDVTDKSGHWQRSQKFLNIVAGVFSQNAGDPPDVSARQRAIICQLIDKWEKHPPDYPVIIAGSTGSRGSTAMLMRAIAGLKQGAVVLPGFDFALPEHTWEKLADAMICEDHPQFRFATLLRALGLRPEQVMPWHGQLSNSVIARNQLVSLALRPAPFTSQWMREGPAMTDVNSAAEEMALIEAPSDRAEAVAIALALRQAAENGAKAALVTPDKLLTRRVKAALDLWKIEPDVSAGEPLARSAPGRLLLHVSVLFGQVVTSDKLLILLKHPLVNSDDDNRSFHLKWTRDLEMAFRKNGPPFPDQADLLAWARKDPENQSRLSWANWVDQVFSGLAGIGEQALTDHLNTHIDLANLLVSGPEATVSDRLWEKPAGEMAQKLVRELQQNAHFGGWMAPADYATLFRVQMDRGEVRDPVRPHPDIMIWGTLEARVQGADLVILGGLNDGVWPEMPSPDPWLNREMRAAAGLLLPERRIGLSAHDFQQAVAAKSIILSRSIRNSEAETVPSRWLNRLMNLMNGMSAAGATALDGMRARGRVWVDMAGQLDTPDQTVPSEPRPSPMPPVPARPRELSVTAISRLIRDPYAIYAANILGLKKLDPLHRTPDAPMRGTVLHKVMEEFIRDTDLSSDPGQSKADLLEIADRVLEKYAPWPAARVLWRAKLERVADAFLRGERERQISGEPVKFEVWGEMKLASIGFVLKGKADRIDQTPDGKYNIYDYKTGAPPTADQLRYFDKQLLLEAIMAEDGAFLGLPAADVADVAHIGLGSTPKFNPVTLEIGETAKIRAELTDLISQYQRREQGYSSRRAMVGARFGGDFDHLARFGEWDETQAPVAVRVGG